MKYKPVKVGEKYGRWTVLERTHKGKRVAWICRCDCGTIKVVLDQFLKTGESKSCGCYNREAASKRMFRQNYKHGKEPLRLYQSWQNMKRRCTKYDKTGCYYNRGIRVCDEWKNSYAAFRKWALKNGYNDKLTIDRIDVNGNYEPSNCRWATLKQQANNKRTNRFVEFNSEKHTLAEWSIILKINYSTVKYRANHNLPLSGSGTTSTPQ